MKQTVIFPKKFWQSGSAGWCDYVSNQKEALKQFLESLEGLQYSEAWGTVTILNGEFIPVDKEGQETRDWEEIILTWGSSKQEKKKLYKVFFCYGELIVAANTKEEVVGMFANDDWHKVSIEDVEEIPNYTVTGPSSIIGGHVE